MKANRVPAALDLTVITLDADILNKDRTDIPPQTNFLTPDGALDVQRSVTAYVELLRANGIHTARVFGTRARLTNGN